ncbi:mitochondrial intermembrane space import and assembly protein-like protein 40 [Dipodascopsis tothii]|uniref:mitochondrial intermembrane space import and assembly protein-like protein 40 n=1 Tax=Dipodascopsis tothii TaxID=44089 RepID=UPI0034CF9FB2
MLPRMRLILGSSSACRRAFSTHRNLRSVNWLWPSVLIGAPVLAYTFQAFSLANSIRLDDENVSSRDRFSETSQLPPDAPAEGGQEGAFNEETGEINWDCPCLGGMAKGPCGEEFKAAFSCFVFSESEPKGADCVEKFFGMQECFRKYPEVYKDELRDDDELESSNESPTSVNIEQEDKVENPELNGLEESAKRSLSKE